MLQVFLPGSGLTINGTHDSLPFMYNEYRARAQLAEEFDMANEEGAFCCVTLARGSGGWPFLVVAQRYDPTDASCFHPGVMYVPETLRLFIGAGQRLLCYDLKSVTRVWEDEAECGFFHWNREGGVVLMAAELELAAWDLQGCKLWTTFVEPPWSYRVEAGRVHLDVMDNLSDFDLVQGPESSRRP